MDAYEGWAADPFGSHEARYFVQGLPTKLVRDGSAEAFDPLPAQPSSTMSSSAVVFETVAEPTLAPPPPAPSVEAVFVSPPPPPQINDVFEPIAEPTCEAPSSLAQPRIDDAFEPVAEPTVNASPPPPTFEEAPDPAEEPPPAPPGTSYWQPPPPPARTDGFSGFGFTPTEMRRNPVRPGHSDTFVGGSAPMSRRRSGKRLLASLVALVVFFVTAGVVVVVSDGKNAAAAVVSSVNTAMAGRTAHVAMSMVVNSPSATVSATGTGAIDFSQNAVALQMAVGVDAQQVAVQAVYIAGSVYESVPGLGQLVRGKSWISIDLSSVGTASSQGPSALSSGNNPTAMLRLLAQQGNTVVPLGPSALDGVSVQGYSVTFDRSAIAARLAHANLPSWMTSALSDVAIQGAAYKVFVDGSGLLRRYSVTLNEAVAAVGTVSVDESFDLSDYGAPVSVSAPPPAQVVTFQQFLEDARAAVG
jgi:hypothetical protein